MIKFRIHYKIETIFTLGTLIQFCFNFANSALPNYLSYCENGNVVNYTQDSCSIGVNFGLGKYQPNCVCVQGIYRIYTDSCTLADGFSTQEICMTLDDESGYNSWSMKLATIPSDFTWDTPAIVANKLPEETWSLNIGPEPVKINYAGDFYAINGKGFVMPDKSICVEPSKETKNVCRYEIGRNLDIWIYAYSYSLILKSSCSGGKPLKSDTCFSPFTSSDSECSISCSATGSNSGLKPGGSKPGVTSKPSFPGGDSVNNLKPTKKTIQLTKEDFDKNCTDPDDYRNHDNRFLNRKMLLYNVINQLDMQDTAANSTLLQTMEPNKTLGLFDFMKNITKKVCPTEYVNSQWIDQVVDLFYILHKGNVFKYEEQLSPEQYQWILDILTQCQSNSTPIALTSMDESKGECSGSASGLATGYCRNSSDGSCDFVPVTVDTTGEDSHRNKHYVPEVAWNIVDAIHVACFPQFNESYRMFHVLEQAVERIFTLQIKNLWHHPGWLEKTKTKLLGFGADTNMYNFDVCIQAAYGLRNGDLPRLVRPFAPVYLRKKRAAASKNKVFIKMPGGRSGSPRISATTNDYDSDIDTTPAPVKPSYQTGCVKPPSKLRKPPNCYFIY